MYFYLKTLLADIVFKSFFDAVIISRQYCLLNVIMKFPFLQFSIALTIGQWVEHSNAADACKLPLSISVLQIDLHKQTASTPHKKKIEIYQLT